MNHIERREYNNLCWMCQINKADSKEHKDKASDLKSYLKLIEDPVIIKYGRKKWINGPNSDLLKYDYLLCKNCNNIKSKKIDSSYDLFSNEYIRKSNFHVTQLHFANLEFKLNVYRYLTKNFCCRLAQNNIDISQDIIDFVNGISNLPNKLIINAYSNVNMTQSLFEELKHNNFPHESASIGRGKLILYSTTNNQDEIDIVYSTLICNNLIFEYYYFSMEQDLTEFYSNSILTLNQYTQPVNLVRRFESSLKAR